MQYPTLGQEISSLADDRDIDGLRKLIQREWNTINLDAQAAWSAGWALVRIDYPREGIWLLERACELAPEDARLPYSLAVAKHAAAEQLLREAESDLRSSLEIRDSWKARVALSELLLQQQRADEGEALLRDALTHTGDVSAEHVLDLADYLDCVGKSDEARRLRSRGRPPTAQ